MFYLCFFFFSFVNPSLLFSVYSFFCFLVFFIFFPLSSFYFLLFYQASTGVQATNNYLPPTWKPTIYKYNRHSSVEDYHRVLRNTTYDMGNAVIPQSHVLLPRIYHLTLPSYTPPRLRASVVLLQSFGTSPADWA